MSFKTYMKYSVVKVIGEILFYIGIALTSTEVGISIIGLLISAPEIMSLLG